jgi:ubiquitin-protein ligase
MSTVRLKRLKSDYEAVRRLANKHPKIEIEGVFGNPPEKYRLILRVQSLRERGVELEKADWHRLEVTLPRGYPRDAPLCRMLTPVFHPNIAPHAVCIGDHWTAAESLDGMIQRVGEMLAFQSYNIKSPLNGRAAQWVEEHLTELPTDAEEFFLEVAAEPEDRSAELGEACSNCATPAGAYRDPGQQHASCGRGHVLCVDCVVRCEKCNGVLCLLCGVKKCAACWRAAVADAPKCANCNNPAPSGTPCSAGHLTCDDCIVF